MKWTSRFAALTLLAAALLLPNLADAAAATEKQYLAGGANALRAKQYDKAIQYYGAALKGNRRSASAAQGLGYAYHGKGNKAKALQYYNYALKLQPNNARLKQMVARLGQGRGSGARNARNKNYVYGVAYLKKRNYQLATQYLTRAGQERPSDPNVWQSLGNAYFGMKNMNGAIGAWDKALTLRPNAKLQAYVNNLKQRQAAIASGGSAAKKAESQKTGLPPGVPDHDNMDYNPWIMGGVVSAIGAIMLLAF
jgi:tetratricopeptide (TPR) repeat protein